MPRQIELESGDSLTDFEHVAVGVIIQKEKAQKGKAHQGKILISKRLAHLHQGGKWEFPGGKIEPGENVLQALKRELFEELSIQIQQTRPLFCIPFSYPDKKVALHIWMVESFSGTAIGREGQEIQWVTPAELKKFEFPEANDFIVESLIEILNRE